MTHAHPATAEARQARRFWDRKADKYSRSPIADEAAYQRKLEITRSYLRTDMDLLEIGCGTGSTALVHAPHVRHIRAVDVSSRMIEIARGKASERGIGNVDFECAAIEDVVPPAGGYDMVLALSLLHLVADWEGAVARVATMLKPGGLFVSNTACLAEGMAWIKYIEPAGRLLGLMPLVSVFSQADLEACLRRNGFEIDHNWKPGKAPAVFMIARKVG